MSLWPRYARTLPELFIEHADASPDHVVMRHKVEGVWQGIAWRTFKQRVLHVAAGFVHLGLKPGEGVAILSQNRPEWCVADFGSLLAAGRNTPIYPTNTAELVAYVLSDSESRFAVVEDQGQLDKILARRDELPHLERVIIMAPSTPSDEFVMSLAELEALGAAHLDEPALHARRRAVDPESVATLIYTSGTTGYPKGVMLSHRNLVSNIEAVRDILPVQAGWHSLSFLPMCHSFGRIETYALFMYDGTLNFAESIEKIPQNLREIHPDIMCSVPRLLEKVYAKIQATLAAAPPLKRALVGWAMGVGRAMVEAKQAKRPPGAALALQYALAGRLVFKKFHEALGGNLKILVYGAAPLAVDIQRFFAGIGIVALEGFGLTETSPVLTGNRPDDFKLGTIGKPITDTQIRIAEDGEILAKGPQIMMGYWRKPEATAEVLGPDGWFHTGDVGEIDADGFVRITDRKKDIIITAGGKNVSPQNIENLLKLIPGVEQAAVIGDKRKYLTALVVPSAPWLADWAGAHGRVDAPRAALVAEPGVIAHFEQAVATANKSLARYETIKRITLLPEEFTVDNNLLTPTMKVRRKAVTARYAPEIEAMYPPDAEG